MTRMEIDTMKLSTRIRKLIADVLLAGVLIALFGTGALSSFDHRLQDALFQRPGLPHPDIVVIGIDEKAIARFGTPDQWSRDLMASAIEILNSSAEYRPAVVALDVLYVGERADAEADARLAAAAREGGNIVTAARAIPGYGRSGSDPAQAVQTIIGIEKPYDALARYADYGLVNAIRDDDLRIRRTRFVYEHDGETLLSFPYVIYRMLIGHDGHEPWADETEKYITYNGAPGTYTLFSFADIFEDDFDPEYLYDTVVLIGALASGLMDDFYVPGQAERMFGVEIHANILQMLLEENLKQYAPNSVSWSVMLLIISSALLLANILEIRILAAAYLAMIAAYAGAALLVFNNGYIITIVCPVLSPVLIYIYQLTYRYVIETIEKKRALLIAEKHQILVDSIKYASVIQRGMLPKENEFSLPFSDHSILWEPRDTVGGDIYWLKNFDKGALLCVCDCTGHGVPGALLTALLVSALEEIVTDETCDDPATIVWMLDQKLARIFEAEAREKKDRRELHIKSGCDLAVVFTAKGGSLKIASGNINTFICDGKEVRRIKGQRVYVGEGRISGAEDVRVTKIEASGDNKFYISSDGLYDQIGGAHAFSFGYDIFKQTVLEHHQLDMNEITSKVWEAFENYQGAQKRRDDITLVAFRPRTVS